MGRKGATRVRTSSHGAKTISTFSPTSSAVGYSEMLSCIWQIQFYGSRCEQTETASLFWIEVCNVFESDQRNGQRQPFVYRHVRRVKAAGGRCGDGCGGGGRIVIVAPVQNSPLPGIPRCTRPLMSRDLREGWVIPRRVSPI